MYKCNSVQWLNTAITNNPLGIVKHSIKLILNQSHIDGKFLII